MAKSKDKVAKRAVLKSTIQAATQFKLDPKQQANHPKKKKNAPDRPQPAWLFPPDELNPVLNPQPKTEEEKKKEIEERLAAIKFLKHKAVNAPVKTPPPSHLLQLVAAFFDQYGFNSTGRIFTLERNARKKLDGWNDNIGKRFAKGAPDLVAIYKEWHKSWEEPATEDETSSDDSEDSEPEPVSKIKTKQGRKNKASGVSSSDDSNASESEGSESESEESDSDSDSDESEVLAKPQKHAVNVNGTKSSSSSSSGSSSDDSDTGTKDGVTILPNAEAETGQAAVNGLKRKNNTKSESSDFSSDSDTDSDSSSSESPTKVAKTSIATPAVKVVVPPATQENANSSASSTSSGSSSSSSESEDEDLETPSKDERLSVATNTGRKSSSDSSTTLKATSPTEPVPTAAVLSSSESSDSDSSSNSSDDAGEKVAPVQTKRKRSASPEPPVLPKPSKVQKKSTERFSRIPADTKVDPRFASNRYQSYDYADRAHQDLIITKGKGFTKEKNKKKRGSYRGGMIDTSGGKGIKFD